MTDKEVQEAVARADAEYDMLKDKVHEQYDEIERLKKQNRKLKATLRLIRKYCIFSFDLNGIEDDKADELMEDLDDVFWLIDLSLGDDKE